MQKKTTILASLSGLALTSVAVVALARVQSARNLPVQPALIQAAKAQSQTQVLPSSTPLGGNVSNVLSRTQIGNIALDGALGQSSSAPISQNRDYTSSGTGTVTRNPMPPEVSKALDEMDNRALAVENQALAFFKQGRLKEAEQTCYRALTLWPKWHGQPMGESTYQLLGDIYREQGRYQEALESYAKTRRHSLVVTQLNLNTALTYLKMGDLKNAHKFYDEHKFFGEDRSPAQRAAYFPQLPGTQSTKTMEASIYFARGCEKSSRGQIDEAVADYKKALALVPHNGRIAFACAGDLSSDYRGMEAIPYWARAAVFGKSETAHEALIRLRNLLMPDKVEQALAQARKIKE